MKSVDPEHDALIVVDMQNDFVDAATGSLYVAGSEALIRDINALSRRLPFRLQVATQDWHTPDHSSFAVHGGIWPPHCIAGTAGAALHPSLDDANYRYILRKGTRQEVDSNSAFRDANGASTGLHALLTDAGVRRVFLVGVALDVCVRATAIDALDYGLQVVILEDVCKAVADKKEAYNLPPDAVIAHSVDYLAGTIP